MRILCSASRAGSHGGRWVKATSTLGAGWVAVCCVGLCLRRELIEASTGCEVESARLRRSQFLQAALHAETSEQTTVN